MNNGMNEKERIKEPTTVKQQIELLKHRNLQITNEEEAMEILSRINYYRLSAYMLSYKNNDWFKEGITFKDVYNLYKFDKKFRNLVIGLLETIEITFRTEIAYFLAHQYGPLGYEKSEYFINEKAHEEMIQQLYYEIERSNEIFVKHHKDKYEGVFPIWVAFEVTSFGLLSRIFSNLKNDVKSKFAKKYYNVPHTYIKSWLYSLSMFRNICAHYGRTYNKNLVIKPMINKKDIKKGIKNDSSFAILFIIKKLIKDKKEWSSFVTNIDALIEQYEIVDTSLMGFPENWAELLK